MTTIAGVKLGNMARSKASLNPKNVGKIGPDPYSYEHRISLDQDAMDKMGITETPKVGDVFHVMGEGHVHSVEQNSSLDGGPRMHISMQMRKMGAKKVSAAPKGESGGAMDAVNKGIAEASE